MKRAIGTLLLAWVLSLCGCLAPSTMDAPAQKVHTVTLEYRVKDNGAVEILSTLQTQQQTRQMEIVDCLATPPLDFSQKLARFKLLNIDTQALPPVEEMTPDALETIIASDGGGTSFMCKQKWSVLEGCWLRVDDSVELFNFCFQLSGETSQTFTQVCENALEPTPIEITEIELWMSEALQATKIPEMHINDTTIGEVLEVHDELTRSARSGKHAPLRIVGTKAVLIFPEENTSTPLETLGQPLSFETLKASLPNPITFSCDDFMTLKTHLEQLSPLIKPVTITIKTLP